MQNLTLSVDSQPRSSFQNFGQNGFVPLLTHPSAQGGVLHLLWLQQFQSLLKDFSLFELASESNQHNLQESSKVEEASNTQKNQAPAKTKKNSAEIKNLEQNKLNNLLKNSTLATSLNQAPNEENKSKPLHTLYTEGTELPLNSENENFINLQNLNPQQQQWFSQQLQTWLVNNPSSDALEFDTIETNNAFKESRSKIPYIESKNSVKKAKPLDEQLAFLQELQAQVEASYKKGKPFRIQMSEDTSVIMSLKQGQVSATYLVKEIKPEQLAFLKAQVAQLQENLVQKKLPVLQLAIRKERDDEQMVQAIEKHPLFEDKNKQNS